MTSWPRNKARQASYLGPWKTFRRIVLQREPECRWKLPGCTGRSTQADHIVPVSRGGRSTLDNLAGSCAHCNRKRGLEESHATLRRKAKGEPRAEPRAPGPGEAGVW